MKRIPLTKDKFALTDDEDYELISKWKWHVNSSGYAVRFQYLGRIDGKKKTRMIRMHRLIMGEPEGMDVDHIDHDTLNNTKANLRVCKHSMNLQNTSLKKDNTSGYKNIHWDSSRDVWRVKFRVDKSNFYGGSFKNIEDAIKVRDEKRKELLGEFA